MRTHIREIRTGMNAPLVVKRISSKQRQGKHPLFNVDGYAAREIAFKPLSALDKSHTVILHRGLNVHAFVLYIKA